MLPADMINESLGVLLDGSVRKYLTSTCHYFARDSDGTKIKEVDV